MPNDPEEALPPDSPAALALERGRDRRKRVPRSAHAGWELRPPQAAVDSVVAANEDRIEELVPVRMGRMAASPFAFLRGSAAAMAMDLSRTPAMGESVQACGDAHLANFGIYASPERRLVFDLNDFDETHPGPWEWDLKRLAASFVVASRENALDEPTSREMARRAVAAYRTWIRRYATSKALDVWYAHIPVEELLARIERPRFKTRLRVSLDDARRRDNMAALGKLSRRDGDSWLIEDKPPLLVRLADDDPLRAGIPALFRGYVRSLVPDRRVLVERYRIVDAALKVVGVGSVGTRCYVGLFAGPAGGPLVLQVKEARTSVLAPYMRRKVRGHQGKRVVEGQRITQAFSDIFLGWTHSPTTGKDYYVRQLYDMKYGIDLDGVQAPGMGLYADICGWALARAHARSGNPATIAGYVGGAGAFDDAVTAFAAAYADQTERDHAAFVAEIKAGRIAAELGV